MNFCDFLFNKKGDMLNNTALVDAHNGRRYTYGQLQEKVRNLSAFISGRGFTPGDIIIVHLYNGAEAVTSMLAIQHAGYVCCTLAPMLKVEELLYYIEDTKSVALITHLKKDQCKKISDHVDLIFVDELEVHCNTPAPPNMPFEPYNFGPEDMSSLLYTAGTTSRPKGVMLAPRCDYAILDIFRTHCYQYVPEDNLLCFVPLSHAFGFKSILLPALDAGATIVTLQGFMFQKILETVEKENITHMYGVPSYFAQFVKHPDLIWPLKKLKVAFCAAAPLKSETAKMWRELVGINLHEGSGMTETNTLTTFRNSAYPDPQGNVGLAPDLLDVKIYDDDGNEVPDGDGGELTYRGKSLMLKYLNRPEETRKTIRDGRLFTGDYAYKKPDGSIVLLGRKSQFINIAGHKIAPFEIECTLNEHPTIEDSVAVGIEDDVYGEIVEAYVKMKEGYQFSERKLIKFVQSKIASFKVPKYIVTVEDFPRNTLGKIDKKALVENYNRRACT